MYFLLPLLLEYNFLIKKKAFFISFKIVAIVPILSTSFARSFKIYFRYTVKVKNLISLNF